MEDCNERRTTRSSRNMRCCCSSLGFGSYIYIYICSHGWTALLVPYKQTMTNGPWIFSGMDFPLLLFFFLKNRNYWFLIHFVLFGFDKKIGLIKQFAEKNQFLKVLRLTRMACWLEHRYHLRIGLLWS